MQTIEKQKEIEATKRRESEKERETDKNRPHYTKYKQIQTSDMR